jgi:gamma-glutamyltranspeptidase/glutathione hydrolase
MGMHGMVSTGHSLASTEALRVLMNGCNAMDAALVAAFVLAVVKSYHCGLGGDAFLLFYSAKERKVYALNGSGGSPVNLQTEHYRSGIPKRGILAAAVPGAVDAWLEAAKKFASLDVKRLVQPAIRYALDGFPVFPNLEKVIASSAGELGKEAAWRKIFLPHGHVPRSGELLYQVDLGRAFQEIAKQGRAVFYEGRIADAIVRTSRDKSGSLCERDLREHRSRWEEPIHCGYKGLDVYVPPPNSYGLLLLLQLKLLSDHDLAPLGHNTAESLEVQLKIKERVARDGDRWIADPDQFDRGALDEWIRNYPSNSITTGSSIANSASGKDTTYIATADGEGNWASLIQSVHQSFGCGVVVEDTGIVLNNRMPGFNLISGQPNELTPGKLPAHTLSPALVIKDGSPIMAIGTPGGMGQTQFLAQMLANIFDYGMNIQQAIEAPRWQSEMAGKVEVERRFASGAIDGLTKQGYDVKVVGPWDHAMGGAEAILRDAHSRVFMGAADPRRDGYAMGY